MTCWIFLSWKPASWCWKRSRFAARYPDEVVVLLAQSAHEKGLELTLNIQSDVPDNAIGDPLRMQQIIVNLLGNAIKFTESGNIDIRVEKRALSNNRMELEVQIHDTGIGISEKQQSQLFGRSARLTPVFHAATAAPGWGW